MTETEVYVLIISAVFPSVILIPIILASLYSRAAARVMEISTYSDFLRILCVSLIPVVNHMILISVTHSVSENFLNQKIHKDLQ